MGPTWVRGRAAATIAGLVRALQYFGRFRNLSAPSKPLPRMRLREPRDSRERTRPRHPATRLGLVGIYRPYQFSVDRTRDCLCRSSLKNWSLFIRTSSKRTLNISLCVRWTVHHVSVDFQKKCSVGFVRVPVTSLRRRIVVVVDPSTLSR